jgi:predicted dehydrogenase
MTESNRRLFLKQGLLAGSALLAPVSLMNLLATDNKPIRADKVRLGIVGTGSRGCRLMELLNSVGIDEGIEIVAICDVYKPNLAIGKGLAPKAKLFSDYRQLIELKDLDAIIVATPLHQHAHITKDALEIGLHVFCEKAMARTLEDTFAMAQAQKRTGKILQIGHQRLFDPKYLEGMKRIHEGVLGEVTQMRAYWHRNNDWRRPVPKDQPELERQINWRLYKEYSCGLVTELASHQIQIGNWAKKALPVDVRGTGSISFWKEGREVHDNIALIFTYADGTQFIYDSMVQNKKYGFEEQIMGHKGTIEFETNRFFLEEPPAPPKPAGIVQLIGNLENNIFDSVPIGSSSWAPELAQAYKGEPLVAVDKTDGSVEQLIGFARAVRQGKPIDGLFEQGYYGSIWTLLAQEAIETGKVITMPESLMI